MILFFISACINETVRYRRVDLTGTLSSEDMQSPMYVSAHHAWYDTDLLAHPAAMFDQEIFNPGDFSWTIDIPIPETFTEGLLIYVWQDTDNDEVFCGLNGDEEYSDMAYIDDETLFQINVQLTPQHACLAPEILYANFFE
ncbi:MAG: hypothetical protein CL916_02770 [Deltaproteobacteria bacterium]|nr:hypothetical protein [Deltaproteobacteria bacterium]